MDMSVRFSGPATNNLRAALTALNALNTYIPQATHLINNGIEFYAAWTQVMSLYNPQHGQNAVVETAPPTVPPQPQSLPIFCAFWDYNYGCFRLAQWNYQFQRWQWVQ